jgi:hypothetical protein
MSAPAATEAAPVETVATPDPLVKPPPGEITESILGPKVADSVDAWSANKRHVVTLPSGTTVAIEIPDLASMIRTGEIPNQLVSVAVDVANGKKVTADDITQQADFYDTLVAKTVVQPVVTTEQVRSGVIPSEDKEMLVELASRQRDFDARGHHVGGLETDAEFRTFRGLLPLDTFGSGL